MYGLSKDTDLTSLVDSKIVRVATTSFQSQLLLDNETEVSIEGDCELDEKLVGFTDLESLVGARIFGATVQEEGSLNLILGDGRRLTLLDSNDSFESYQIVGPGINVIV